ncbi:OmpH family outer membrane protein [Hyphobacterium sp. CCMP332]|nr:OmpH family outer membrane protein [Hyphobacterium sp. CCMP332]
MKKIALFLFLAPILSYDLSAQRFGYVDANFILTQMPDYKKAEEEVNSLSKAWQDEISKMKSEIQSMYDELKAEEVLLTKEMVDERKNKIKAKEEALKEYQQKTFGYDGLLFLKRQELIQPVQDKIYEAIEEISRQKKLHIMFDKSGDLVMLYTDPRYDYTDFVLEELGLKEPEELEE